MQTHSELMAVGSKSSRIITIGERKSFGEEETFELQVESVADLEGREFEDRFAYLQGWYIRACYPVKISTLETLLQHTSGPQILRIILRAIASSNTKDVIYAKSQLKTRHVYDRVPEDDNRAMDQIRLAQAMKDDVRWFSSLNEKRQVTVVCGLLRLGGGGTIRFGFEKASKLLGIRAIQAVDQAAGLVGASSSRENSFTPAARQFNTDTLPAEVNARVDNERKQWDSAVAGFKKKLGMIPVDGKKPKDKEGSEEYVDRVQLLTVWGNRYMCEYIPGKTLAVATKVNRYWAEMSRDFKNAKTLRKFLQTEINKLSDKGGNKEKRDQREKEQTGSKQNEGGFGESEFKRGEQGIRESFGEGKMPVSRIKYGRYTKTRVVEEYLYSRQLAVDPSGRSMAMTKPFRVIGIYSLLTGSELYPTLTGHTAMITCLVYQPLGNHVVSGSVDTTLRLWDIWGSECLQVYQGHQAPVTAISISQSDLLVSTARDSQVRLWELWSGDVLHVIIGKVGNSAHAIVITNDTIFTGLEGGQLKTYALKNEDLQSNFIEAKERLAHDGSITAIVVKHPLVITAGIDSFIKVWRYEGLIGPLHILDNKNPVQCFAFSNMTILSGDNQGMCRTWDCITGQLLHIQKVMSDVRRIMNVCCIDDIDHTKLVINMETGVTVYEFVNIIPDVARKMKLRASVNKFHKINCHAIQARKAKPVPGQFTLRDRRVENLSRKCCTLPELRQYHNRYMVQSQMPTESVLFHACPQDHEQRCFRDIPGKLLGCRCCMGAGSGRYSRVVIGRHYLAGIYQSPLRNSDPNQSFSRCQNVLGENKFPTEFDLTEKEKRVHDVTKSALKTSMSRKYLMQLYKPYQVVFI